MIFQNALSQQLYDLTAAPLQLTLNADYQDLNTINTLQGEKIGSVFVFSGLRIAKMVIAEFITGPGMVASLVVIKPEYHYDVPRFGSDFSLMGDKLHLDMDFFPHRDLATAPDYYQQYYQPLSEHYLQAMQQFHLTPPQGLWLRNYISPLFFMTDAEPAKQLELEQQALSYMQQWLIIWANNIGPVDSSSLAQIQLRAQHFEQLSMQHNPVLGMFGKILGEELAHRVIKSLY
ncbi:hypothetical protein [Oceanicoccus sp. KOV_DT_Chl]|uniref:hypothetical protein n=1 Tax=Oceanicoccus sp. KOV_DT_Chl TaxID=1904639 RepID=UPI000C7A9BF6|nr:hypothetical protein [Oceanicoccus sp. KOV_DT_Chl]